MPLNRENALLDLPDFVLGEAPQPQKTSEFEPLFDGPGKLEMVSDIIIETPVAEQQSCDAFPHPCQTSASNAQETEQEVEVPGISLEEHQGIIDNLKRRCEDDLNGLRESHQNEVLRQLDIMETRLFENISNQLESKVAQALAPLVQTCVSRNTLDALVNEIRSIVGKEALKSLHISGPPMLTLAVKQKLSNDQLNVEVEETDGAELVVCLDDELISTRLEEWGHKIETAIF